MQQVHYALIMALKAEATPVISHYKLKQLSHSSPFPVWKNNSLSLIISGPGQMAAATATAWFASFLSDLSPLYFINFGVAGHSCLPLGTPVIPHCIEDVSSCKLFYPICFSTSYKMEKLYSVTQVEHSYKKQGLYDMESSGFFYAASRFVTLEQIGLFKVVSDNQFHRPDLVTKQKLHELILSSIPDFEKWLTHLPSISLQKDPVVDLEKVYQVFHLTYMEKYKLQQLCKKMLILSIPLVQIVENMVLHSCKQDLFTYVEKCLADFLETRLLPRM